MCFFTLAPSSSYLLLLSLCPHRSHLPLCLPSLHRSSVQALHPRSLSFAHPQDPCQTPRTSFGPNTIHPYTSTVEALISFTLTPRWQSSFLIQKSVLLAIGLLSCFRHAIIAFLAGIIKWVTAINAADFPEVYEVPQNRRRRRAQRDVPWQSSCFEPRRGATLPSRTARRRHARKERKERWQEEQRRNLEEAYRRHQQASGAPGGTRFWQEEHERTFEDHHRSQQQQTSKPSASTTAFTKWRKHRHTLLQTPGLIAKMPQPPRSPCSSIACNTTTSCLGVCSHSLRKQYENLRLDEQELKNELRLWHPNGAKVNQVGENCKVQVLGMANEIAHVLQEMLKDM